MCTVTYIPGKNNGFILTSNRDEAVSRKTLPPDVYKENGVEILWPKDAVAGGSWIGVSDKNRLICLLNGAFINHVRRPAYRHSRGIVVRELLQTEDPDTYLKEVELNNVEPFTVLVLDWRKDNLQFTELIWDETQKHFRDLATDQFHIWSSSTLYSNSMKAIRKNWFESWIENGDYSQDSIIDFHLNAGCGDPNIDLQIDRGSLKTVSVTSVLRSPETVSMCYRDLIEGKQYKKDFETISL